VENSSTGQPGAAQGVIRRRMICRRGFLPGWMQRRFSPGRMQWGRGLPGRVQRGRLPGRAQRRRGGSRL